MKFKSAFIVLLAVFVIATLIPETESLGSRRSFCGNHLINKVCYQIKFSGLPSGSKSIKRYPSSVMMSFLSTSSHFRCQAHVPACDSEIFVQHWENFVSLCRHGMHLISLVASTDIENLSYLKFCSLKVIRKIENAPHFCVGTSDPCEVKQLFINVRVFGQTLRV